MHDDPTRIVGDDLSNVAWLGKVVPQERIFTDNLSSILGPGDVDWKAGADHTWDVVDPHSGRFMAGLDERVDDGPYT